MSPTSTQLPEVETLYDSNEITPSTARKGRIAVSTLNQWALDFEGNGKRTLDSIYEAKAQGARYRLGPELEISGYSCEDHFYEEDTTRHSAEVLAQILSTDATDDILTVIGLPLIHEGVRYNCDAYVLNRKIVGLRPKKFLADDGNYREPRWFTSWDKDRQVEDYNLPPILQAVTGQKTVTIGDFLVETNDTILGTEKCEEMFTAKNPGVDMALDGAELLGNGSGSHWQIRKLNTRVDLITNSTRKAGGIYAYSNFVGGDGGRLVFDGSSMIAQNGKLLAQGEQFSLKEVETVTADVDFASVQSLRGSIRSFGEQADAAARYPRIKIDFNITNDNPNQPTSDSIDPKYLTTEEEIAKGPAVWLWDYLRRSGASGFFLPLSGGVDSGSTAAIVGSMCHMVIEEAKNGNEQVIKDARRIIGEPKDSEYIPNDPKEFANRIFHTAYMANKGISSKETEARAARLAEQIGAYHVKANIAGIVDEFKKTVAETLHFNAKFESEGGAPAEDLALQNIQARTRMALGYMLAQLLRPSQGKNGFLLVLGSANVDEANRGYFTKYDCSSADINPIGGINKTDLRSFCKYAAEKFGFEALLDIVADAPTAELRPMKSGEQVQKDEDDMGMTYEELRIFATLRKVERMGPVGMFEKLIQEWGPQSERGLSVREVARKVINFFKNYAINRHKLTTLTPSVHAESYSPDDNRFDLRPFLYNVSWAFQVKRIWKLVEKYEKAQ